MARSNRSSRVRALLIAGIANMAFLANAYAQQAAPGQNDFDPVTRTFSSKNPPIATPPSPDGSTPLTPEQQEELDEQKQQAQIQQMRAEAKKKREAAIAAQKAKEEAAKAAETKRMAMLKQMREDRIKEMKENREKLAALLQEQKDARVAYEKSKQSATGSTQSIDDDYRKAEKDREQKIQELRHPKYKPITLPSTTDNNSSTGTSTALPGTTTTGNGPNVTNH